jgi:hypothetical protein
MLARKRREGKYRRLKDSLGSGMVAIVNVGSVADRLSRQIDQRKGFPSWENPSHGGLAIRRTLHSCHMIFAHKLQPISPGAILMTFLLRHVHYVVVCLIQY